VAVPEARATDAAARLVSELAAAGAERGAEDCWAPAGVAAVRGTELLVEVPQPKGAKKTEKKS
jgi:predicted nucleic acid-binding protein